MKISEIKDNLHLLTPRQRGIAEAVLDSPDEVSYMTLKELSERTAASEVTILRFCRALGYSGYSDFKKALQDYSREHLIKASPLSFLSRAEDRKSGDFKAMLRAVFEDDLANLSAMMAELDAEKLTACVKRLMAASEVKIFAHDGTFIIAEYLANRLRFLRVNVHSVNIGNSDSVQTMLAGLDSGDYVILLSFPPYYRPISNIAHFCAMRKVPLMTITDSGDSPAATRHADVFLCATAARYYYNSQVSTISFFNILASCIAYELGDRFEEILEDERDVSDYISAEHRAAEALL